MKRSQSSPSASANPEQVERWNVELGPTWVAHQETLDRQLEPLGLLTLERAAPRPGERALDVGCGCGATTLELARRLGAAGSVLGVDVSQPMLSRARERAATERSRAPLATLDFLAADAQTHAFAAQSFDLLFSRFGVMFFADPPRAFANLRAALRPGGRLAFVCWQALARNPWMLIPLGAAGRHLTLPAPPPPDAPGPFAFADAARVEGILAAAGFGEIAFEDVPTRLVVGRGDLPSAVEVVLAVGPLAAVLREQGADAALRERVAAAVQESLAPHATPEGVALPAAAWIVTARS